MLKMRKKGDPPTLVRMYISIVSIENSLKFPQKTKNRTTIWSSNPTLRRRSRLNYNLVWSHHFMANRWGNNGNSDRLFLGLQKSLQLLTAAMKLKDACSLEGKLTNLDSILKSRDITLPITVCLVKAMGFLVVMYGCKKESWVLKNWCF